MAIDDALARLTSGLDEDERIARATGESASHLSPDWHTVIEDGVSAVVLDKHHARVAVDVGAAAPHIARQSPKSTLDRVEALRKVLAVCDAIDADALDGSWWEDKYGDYADEIREALASIYPTEES